MPYLAFCGTLNISRFFRAKCYRFKLASFKFPFWICVLFFYYYYYYYYQSRFNYQARFLSLYHLYTLFRIYYNVYLTNILSYRALQNYNSIKKHTFVYCNVMLNWIWCTSTCRIIKLDSWQGRWCNAFKHFNECIHLWQ